MISNSFLSSSEQRDVTCVRAVSVETTGSHDGPMRSCCLMTASRVRRAQSFSTWTMTLFEVGTKSTALAAGGALSTDRWMGGQSRMTPAQKTVLCTWLDERFCRSALKIRAYISGRIGLDYSHSGCIKLPAQPGFKYRKPKGLPRVAPAEEQAEFIALQELLLNGSSADEAGYFADAVHPEYQAKPSYGWVKARSNPAVTIAGRGRVNIHDTLTYKPLMRLSSSRPPWTGSAQRSFLPRSKRAILTLASSMSSGIMSLTIKAQTLANSSKDPTAAYDRSSCHPTART